MSDWMGIVWLVVLLIGNAFFVGAEFAIISARRSQIEPRAEKGSGAAKLTLWAMEHATLMLAMCQLGITICSLLILLVSEPAIHHLLEGPIALLGLPEAAVSPIAFAIALIIVTYLHVVFGEMVPKNISFSVPDRSALILGPPLVFFARVFRPIIWALNGVANGIIRLFGVTPKNEATSAYTLEEVETIVATSVREGLLDDVTGTIGKTFEFTEKRVGDAAVPLAEVVRLPAGATPDDVEAAVREHGFSRYVIDDELGRASGYLHIKDILGLDATRADQPVPARLVRPLPALDATTELEDALARMRESGSHLVRSVQSGRTEGVLFLEDIIEELVGEVRDATLR